MERPRRMNPDEVVRHTLFEQNKVFLAEAAGRVLSRGIRPQDFVTVVIDVDDPVWTEAVNILMPGHNWEAMRNKGETPLARGTADDTFARAVGLEVPDVAAALHPDFVPEGQIRSLAMAGGGASVYYLRPSLPTSKIK